MISNNSDLLSNDLQVTPTMQANLLTASGWGKFLAIIGFLGCLLMVFAGIAVTMVTSSGAYPYRSMGVNFVYMGLGYIVMGVLFFFPCLYLMRFCTKVSDAAKNSNQESMESAMSNLKSMFKFMGIMTIVIIVLYILMVGFITYNVRRY